MTDIKKLLPDLSGAPSPEEAAGQAAMQKTFTQANFIASWLDRKLDDCPGVINSIPVAIAGLNLSAKAISQLSPPPEVIEFILQTYADALEGYGVDPASFARALELMVVRRAGGPGIVQ